MQKNYKIDLDLYQCRIEVLPETARDYAITEPCDRCKLPECNYNAQRMICGMTAPSTLGQQGLCRRCGGQATPGKKSCATCRATELQWKHKRLAILAQGITGK